MILKYSKGVLMYTDEGLRILGIQYSNRKPWTKEEAFKYCNHSEESDFQNQVRANKLKLKSVLFNTGNKEDKDWYKNTNNFKEIDITIDYYK
jgi:hypothetical protein